MKTTENNAIYFHKTYGRATSYTHPSVRHGWGMLRTLLHLVCLRVCLQVSGEGTSRVVCLRIGPGAGYVTGATAYVAFNAKDSGGNIYVRRKIQAGFTRNWNRVPRASR